MAQDRHKTPAEVLQSVFGYSQFRPLQEEAIGHILQGQDALVIMPTGGGKSLCYQVPAVILPGITVVISPLIALMKDQVEALRANGIPAAAINSALDDRERQQIHQQLREGRIKLLYLSPEKALSQGFAAYLATLPISLLAVDEAHCVSMWGNDFRPEYAALPTLFEALPRMPILALTATADPATREDIVAKLGLRQPQRFISSFERHNLYLEVQPAQQRLVHIQRFIQRQQGEAGIIYCLSRKSCEDVANRLSAQGVRAAAYHARLDREVRNRVQEAFQKDQIQVVCATVAFGMGIDKSNIRWVVHYNLPKNVESYYQEIGRAGRDGLPAHTLLFAGFGDVMTYRTMIEESEALPAFRDVQIAKLDRMFEFAQARSCRTNFILGYFGESKGEPCGHCDLCRHPPTTFDGSILAQKALSALRRTDERVGIQLLVDILRGALHQDIRQAGYDRIKTFGSGRDISRNHWLQYVTQLLNLGVLYIDYAAQSRLRISPLGEEVLYGRRQVSLVRPLEPADKGKAPARTPTAKPKDLFQQELLNALRLWRQEEAQREGISPTHLLSDSSLAEIIHQRVLFHKELAAITGLSVHKRQRYGEGLLATARRYILQQSHLRQPKGSSALQTLLLLEAHGTVEAVSRERGLSPGTIYAHLQQLIEMEEPLSLHRWIPEKEYRQYGQLWDAMGRPEALAPLLQRLPADTDPARLRLALAGWRLAARA